MQGTKSERGLRKSAEQTPDPPLAGFMEPFS